MAPWILPLAQSVLSAQQNRRAEQRARQEAIADMHQQRASSLGFPAYGAQAARTNRDLDDEYGQRNYLAGLLPLLMSRRGGQ